MALLMAALSWLLTTAVLLVVGCAQVSEVGCGLSVNACQAWGGVGLHEVRPQQDRVADMGLVTGFEIC